MKKIIVYLSIIVCMFFLTFFLSMTLMQFDVYRLRALTLSTAICPLIAWMIYPLVYWRPMTVKVFAYSLLCILLGYALSAILIFSHIRLPYVYSGSYGFINGLIYSLLPAIFFEWINFYKKHWLITKDKSANSIDEI